MRPVKETTFFRCAFQDTRFLEISISVCLPSSHSNILLNISPLITVINKPIMYDRNSVALWSSPFSTNPPKMLNPDRIIHISPWWINVRQRDYETALCITSSCLIIKTNNLQVKSWDIWPVTTVSPTAEKQHLALACISLLTQPMSAIESYVGSQFPKTIASD